MPDPREAWAFVEISDLVAGAGEVQAAIHRLAGEIKREFKDRYPLVLVVMGGAPALGEQDINRNLRFNPGTMPSSHN